MASVGGFVWTWGSRFFEKISLLKSGTCNTGLERRSDAVAKMN
jgi:hypothetical protein